MIAVATQDFEVYHDLVRYLRANEVPFETLDPGEPVPGHVDVVITTEPEAEEITHPAVVAFTTPHGSVEEAMGYLKGVGEVTDLVIGIDPGERPGVAVLADGHILSSRQVADPARVVAVVQATAERFTGAEVIVRVGHGAATLRDRIVNGLLDAGFSVQLVDETSTSPPRRRLHGERDQVAARTIALTPGIPIYSRRQIDVPPGELREIQRRSRMAAQGEVTISTDLARKVATGALSLAEAIERQQAKQVGPSG